MISSYEINVFCILKGYFIQFVEFRVGIIILHRPEELASQRRRNMSASCHHCLIRYHEAIFRQLSNTNTLILIRGFAVLKEIIELLAIFYLSVFVKAFTRYYTDLLVTVYTIIPSPRRYIITILWGKSLMCYGSKMWSMLSGYI